MMKSVHKNKEIILQMNKILKMEWNYGNNLELNLLFLTLLLN